MEPENEAMLTTEKKDGEVMIGLTGPFTMQGRTVRRLDAPCPICGVLVHLFVTPGDIFTLTWEKADSINVWHYEVRGDRITVTPSIDFSKNPKTGQPFPPHGDGCHFFITDQPYIEVMQ